ncbi:hypothetical protein [Plantactinospora sp. B5E13]|uniref:hypothetical protein n=1 Tax=Plantactinospora sp. B5E13 TaxID=3153758 RepID=UPI00325CCB78
MTQWEVWRQDDNGNEYRVAVHPDRIAALAQLMVLESGVPHKQLYRVAGPSGPVCRTNRDLYRRVLAEGRRMTERGRTLDEFLRGWWQVARPLAGRARLDLDEVAAMLVAAGSVEPPPIRPEWRSTSFEWLTVEPRRYVDWQSIVRCQIADLADFADQGPLPPYAGLGLDAPRPGGQRRCIGVRWYNFDPASYLECGLAGALGGWDPDDDVRVELPGPVVPLRPEPGPEEVPVETLTWDDLAEFAVCGQEYE